MRSIKGKINSDLFLTRCLILKQVKAEIEERGKILKLFEKQYHSLLDDTLGPLLLRDQ